MSRLDTANAHTWGGRRGHRMIQISREMAALPKYRYTKLTDPARYIRLLRVLGGGESWFSCELAEICILGTDSNGDIEHKQTQYAALSYTWGEPDARKVLVINGTAIRVWDNVFNFLNFTNASRKAEWFWIDAVCIDQLNFEERNQQIKLMTQIYSQATRVCVWLGHGNENLSWLFRDINKDENGSNSLYITQMRELQDPEYRINAQNGFGALNELDYWTRMWVVQEVFFAQNVLIHYGTECVPWDKLHEAWLVRKKLPQYGVDSVRLSSDREIDNMISIRHDSKILAKRKISSLLFALQGAKCTFQHDRIYAALSLVESGDGFPVDYESSVIELLVETLAFIVRTEPPDPDRIYLARSISEKLLSESFDLDNHEPVFASKRSGLQGTHIPRGTGTFPEQPWPSEPRKILLPKCHTGNDSRSLWVSYKISDLFSLLHGEEAEDTDKNLEYFQELFQGHTNSIYTFLHSNAEPSDSFCWNSRLELLFILRPDLAAGQSLVDQSTTFAPKRSRYSIVGRVAFDSPGNKDEPTGYFEMYSGLSGLSGARFVLETEMDGSPSDTSQFIEITDPRAEIVLFGLPEHQGIRLAAMDLMVGCGGHPGFMANGFWTCASDSCSGSILSEDDIEVIPIASENHHVDGVNQYIRHRRYTDLCEFSTGSTHVRQSDNDRNIGSQDSRYYFIDFLSEEDRRKAAVH